MPGRTVARPPAFRLAFILSALHGCMVATKLPCNHASTVAGKLLKKGVAKAGRYCKGKFGLMDLNLLGDLPRSESKGRGTG